MKTNIEYYRNPTNWEIKFGEGAIHWLEINEDLLPFATNKKGDLKKWFVNPFDGLRYYRPN